MQTKLKKLSFSTLILLTILLIIIPSCLSKQVLRQKSKIHQNIRILKKFNNQLNNIESLFHNLKKNNDDVEVYSFQQYNTSYILKDKTDVNSDENYDNEENTENSQQALYKTNTLSSDYQGPLGYQCKSQEECLQKNKQFYKQIKTQLLGLTGLNGEIGPTGDKGDRGERGPRGKQGADGVSPSKSYLEQVSRQIVQIELQNLSKDQIISIEEYDPDFLYQEIFYGSYENCHGPRLEFLKNCQNSEQQKCGKNGEEFCCKSLKCMVTLDEMFCCMQKKKAAPHIIDEWDLNKDATWFDAVKEVQKRQVQAQSSGSFKKNHLLIKYQRLMNQCQKQSFFDEYQLQCDIYSDKDSFVLFQNQTSPIQPAQPITTQTIQYKL